MASCKEYCKECIHNDICDLQKIIIENRDSCKHFKNRNRFVELPCKIGDNIYKIGEFINGIKILRVDHFRIFCDCVELMSDPWDGGICETHQVGKIVKEEFDWNGYFLSKEEAKQALDKENNRNG